MKKRTIFICLMVLMAFSLSAQTTFLSKLPAKPKKGTNVYGVVECQGKPLCGVAVSDGQEIVVTDKKGVYSFLSAKRYGYVFVILPSGYEIETCNAVPQIWANLDRNALEAERHDFSLSERNNDRHVMIAVTDIHIANKFDDIDQFKNVFMPRFREEVEKYRSNGLPVYSMCMGDTSFDRFWYQYYFSILDFIPLLKEVNYPVPIFHTTGNHDNDAATPQGDDMDFRSTQKYRSVFGPTFYSMNIGKIHYIMLDNIYYLNKPVKTPTFPGLTGDHSYECHLNDEELAWLRKDLALVDRDTPIVVGMHGPAYIYVGVSKKIRTKFHGNALRSKEDYVNEFSEVFKDFREVHYITGHSHMNAICYGKDDTSNFPYIANTIEHNITGVCGAWWMTYPYGGLSLAPDGGDSGFEVFPVNDNRIEWYFVSNDQGCEKQFRVFDMNSVREIYRTYGDFKPMIRNYKKRTDYSKIEDNMIMINVFAWDPNWELHVYENGTELEWKRVMAENPLYTWTYYIPHSSWSEKWKPKYGKDVRPHYFMCKAQKADSTIDVVLKDTFGHVYKESVTRPKPFNRSMK